MKKFFSNHSKIFFMIFLVLGFVLLISCVAYATEYTHAHIFYQISDGVAIFSKDYGNDVAGLTNLNVYQGFERATNVYPNGFTNDFARTVYDFQKSLASVNDFIVVTGVITLVAVAVLFIFSNHSRKVYYKSNLIVGIVCRSVIIIFNVVLLVRNFLLMGQFNDNYDLLNWVSVLQDPKTTTYASQHPEVIPGQYSCTTTTFIIYAVLFIIVIAYAAMMIVYTVLKYKNTTEKRIQILERAVNSNE